LDLDFAAGETAKKLEVLGKSDDGVSLRNEN
jgi:hypothetical protein